MMLQTAVADVLGPSCGCWPSPASIHSVPTGANREDHVAMGPAAARKAARAVRAFSYVTAVELICAAEAVEHHRPLKTSPPAREGVRASSADWCPRLERDRPLTADVEAVAEAVRRGVFGP